jgi:hypothetical protein
MTPKQLFYRAIVLAMLLPMAACSATSPTIEKPATNLTGLWRGEIRVIPCPAYMPATEAGRCNAINRITFNLRQTESSLEGTYNCANGTLVCRDENTTTYGTVTGGTLSGRNLSMRVLLPGDLSSCLYNGLETSPGAMRGSYRCYQGGGLVEYGQWQVSRAENEQPPWRPE